MRLSRARHTTRLKGWQGQAKASDRENEVFPSKREGGEGELMARL